MNKEEFRNIEIKFQELKNELSQGNITTEEMRNELKQLMIKDGDGNYWMIGGKTGKWYYFNGTKWIRKDPEILNDEISKSQTVLIDSVEDIEKNELENNQNISENMDEEPKSSTKEPRDNATILLNQDLKVDKDEYKFDSVDSDDGDFKFEDKKSNTTLLKQPDPPVTNRSVKCRSCGDPINFKAKFCNNCGESVKPGRGKKKEKPAFVYNKDEIEIKKLKLSSMIFLFGGLGVVVGVVIGAVFGVLDVFPELLSYFPAMLQDARGKLQGGLIFGALGGITFSLVHMILAAIIGIVYNALSSIIGGIRFKV